MSVGAQDKSVGMVRCLLRIAHLSDHPGLPNVTTIAIPACLPGSGLRVRMATSGSHICGADHVNRLIR
jgi:hypothetical protein